MSNDLPLLIQSLRNSACYKLPVETVTAIATNVSFILLTSSYAYKIKKPLDPASFSR